MSQDFGVNQALVEDQYRRYLDNPLAVDAEWRAFFEDLSEEEAQALLGGNGSNGTPIDIDESLLLSVTGGHKAVDTSEVAWRLSRLVTAFRSRGHYYATIDPLGLSNVPPDELDATRFGLSEASLEFPVQTDIAGLEQASPRQVIDHMRDTYCGTIGFELMHIEDPVERQWLLDHIEAVGAFRGFSGDELIWMLERLTDAQELERFLHTQYIGAKRFSLEGLETVIPMLHDLIDEAGRRGVTDVVIGMAHRGRLNVLVNIMRKSLRGLFSAFNDAEAEELIGRGDVKYHLGYTTEYETSSGNTVNVSLCFNPSHLEFVNPVVVGRCRARMDRKGDGSGRCVLPIMIHGDAAFIGQGIVAETLNLAELEGYRTGGTVHIVLNNQLGFTTSPSDSRSSRYASDMVRFLRSPVFHINADDVAGAVRIMRLAAEYRQLFLRDVCIDLVGYRRYGHNESDEPRFTQPRMYGIVDNKTSIRDGFAERLVESDVISGDGANEMISARRGRMKNALEASRENPVNAMPSLTEKVWQGYFGGPEREAPEVPTRVDLATLQQLVQDITTIPEHLHAHPKVARLYKQRSQAIDPDKPFDWGTGEALAFASLVQDGTSVRLSGQDSRRGTFSHRHSYVVDIETGARWTPFSVVARDGAKFHGWDSPLSEAAVLGFEYGYSLENPDGLVVWEAQFGDFANGAQVIIDQFINSGEDKWNRLSGVVMLLPHGFEGQGPEHSYARLDRFLQLCAEDCWQVCDCTTPAQFFHLLRRQVLRPWRKPLIVMTPKSLLRHKRAVSTLRDLAEGKFHKVLHDASGADPNGVERVLLCSGRVYYDLEAEREKREAWNVHIIRIEQLYPIPGDELAAALSPYPSGTDLLWVQDEPWNIGAWYFVNSRLRALFGNNLPLQCVARAESASPATGSAAAHRHENAALMEAAFSGIGAE